MKSKSKELLLLTCIQWTYKEKQILQFCVMGWYSWWSACTSIWGFRFVSNKGCSCQYNYILSRVVEKTREQLHKAGCRQTAIIHYCCDWNPSITGCGNQHFQLESFVSLGSLYQINTSTQLCFFFFPSSWYIT